MTTSVPSLAVINFKAGDTFHYAGTLAYAALDTGADWGVRASVRDLSKKERPLELVTTLTATIGYPETSSENWTLTLYKSAASTASWPRPNDPSRPHKLVCDIEIFDNYDPSVVISTSSFIIAVQYDPTRSTD